ncbi:hypothetical protein [Mesorhizobium sp. M0619]|uniref:hypothetical protein n=1 Tax=unclassified Mesorhizobium TaxID=325217 RepID=UPI0033376045
MEMVDFAGISISRWSATFLSHRPLALAAVFSVAGTIVATWASRDSDINSLAIYSGIFDLLTVFTGFIATFFVFVGARQNEFLAKIQNTMTFKAMLRLLRFTLVWSAAMIFASYVLVIMQPKDVAAWSIMQGIIWFWFYNLGLIVVNFVRCIRQFNTIISAGK